MTDEPQTPGPTALPIASLLQGIFGQGDGIHGDDKPPKLTEKEKVDLLLSARERYYAPAPAIGMLITPRKDSMYSDIGEPHLVVEQILPPFRAVHDNSGSNAFWAKLDIRVVCIGQTRRGPYIQAFAVESWQFEPWVSKNET